MKNYNLQLIMPTHDEHVYEFVENYTAIPLTLLSLAALTPENYNIKIIDESVEKIKPSTCDLVAISVILFTAEKSYRIADWYRKRGIPVIMGGVHPTTCPKEVIKHCDAIVMGEAEEIWSEVLKDFENNKLKKIYKEKRKPSLANTPIPRYDLVDKSKYNLKNLIQTSRGCAFGCDFCMPTVFNGKMSRHKPVEKVIDEIKESLRNSKNIWKRLIMFTDDNIVNDFQYAKDLFKALMPLNIRWGSQCSISIAYDNELLELAYKSGCRVLFIGFETPNQKSLKEIKKDYNVKKFDYYIKKIKRKGILILGSFVFGFDNDNKDVFRKTMNFCMKNNIDFVNFHILGPTPGTPLFNKMEKEGRIIHKKWKYYQENPVFKPKNMSIKELEYGQIWCYEKYFKISNILKRTLKYITRPKWMIFVLIANISFKRKISSGIKHQKKFIKYYNKEILRI